ncbi:MAG: biosynthetic-type acetolactate synthase large subunit [Gemmiger sp.]|uniref:biosynthetic-type acetolactate synthase large subunit n=1 Tax=Gemmiger sp. TaxID=2049027 RepID=UPI002A914630|nr:biosynthetic-type acetolactate synthase large subunit [Gemmiger sp.]MBD8952954.1 biosynthetic-type acetolactate synthase large subunit [Subdoligranulum sp.]MDY5410133.1 biosynthetic-type acetolactate synthase large subunit [Gemmiger sp.]
MKLTGSQIFVEVLVEQGVDTLFGYPGGAVLNLYDELYKNSDRIRHVLTAHEQGASHAADGYARATGRTGVVLATSGPGATNLVTGIATAYMDSVPMVAFTGNVATTLLGKDSFQEAYIEGITMPITKHNYTVRRVEDLADTMRAAFRIAQSGRKGPVLVDIPKDVTAAVCEFTPKEPELIRTVTSYNETDVEKAAEMINEAKRPIVYFGGGVRSAAGCQPLRDLLIKADIPATYTLMAAGVLSYGEEHNLGLLGMHGCYTANKAIDEADLVIAVGTRFSDRVALNPDAFAKRAKIIQIDIDPSELGKNVDIDLSLNGDASYVLQAILPHVKPTKHTDWMDQIHAWQATDYKPTDSDTELKPHQIINEICEQAGPEAVYVTDVGQHQMWAAQYLHHTKSRGFLTSGGLGTMGFGYGAAIGAQMALGRDARVVMLTGDGSFHMNLNEGCTAVSYDLPIITVIFNNQVLGMVRQWQTTFYEKRYSDTDPHRKTDFVKLAEAFGAKGYRATTPAEFKAALADAMKQHGPSWIDCRIGKDEKVLPMIPGGGTIDDIIME